MSKIACRMRSSNGLIQSQISDLTASRISPISLTHTHPKTEFLYFSLQAPENWARRGIKTKAYNSMSKVVVT
jgi:hypothetical protein